MVVKLLLILILNGQHLEFVDQREFKNLEACNTAAFAIQVRMSIPWAVTCFVEHRA